MSSSIFISIFNVSKLKLQDFEYEDEYPETLVLYNTVQCCTVLNINIHLNIRISSSSDFTTAFYNISSTYFDIVVWVGAFPNVVAI